MARKLLLGMGLFLASRAFAAPGDLDTMFGQGAGWVATSLPGSAVNVYSMVRQSDGKIVLGGTYTEVQHVYLPSQAYDYTKHYQVLVRYNPDGSLDTSFNGTGKLVTDFGDAAYSVIQQTDGKLVVSGENNDKPALSRYNADGSLDTAFYGTGHLELAISSDYRSAGRAVIEQSDGKLVMAVAGSYLGCEGSFVCSQPLGYIDKFYLARFNANGTLDSTFDIDGIAEVSNTMCTGARALIQQADGNYLVVGETGIARFHSDGSAGDLQACSTTSTPIIFGDPPPEYSYEKQAGHALLEQADGKFVIAGTGSDSSPSDFTVTRLKPDNYRDKTFNGRSIQSVDFEGYHDDAQAFLRQHDGKYMLAGFANRTDGHTMAFARLNADGSLDTTFQATGKRELPIGVQSEAAAIIQQPDGKLLVAGTSDNRFVLLRLESGEPDSDGDGLVDSLDAFPIDADNDGIDDNADPDDDNDGVTDAVDSEPLNPAVTTEIRLPLNTIFIGSSSVEQQSR